MAIKIFTSLMKKTFNEKKFLRLFNKITPLYVGTGPKQQNFQQLPSSFSERTLFAI